MLPRVSLLCARSFLHTAFTFILLSVRNHVGMQLSPERQTCTWPCPKSALGSPGLPPTSHWGSAAAAPVFWLLSPKPRGLLSPPATRTPCSQEEALWLCL